MVILNNPFVYCKSFQQQTLISHHWTFLLTPPILCTLDVSILFGASSFITRCGPSQHKCAVFLPIALTVLRVTGIAQGTHDAIQQTHITDPSQEMSETP